MTILAETLGKIIRERGGYLSSHDQWLEEKADELRKIVYREICMERFSEWYDNAIDACVVMIERLHEQKLL